MKRLICAFIMPLASLPVYAQSSGVRFTVGCVSQGVNVAGNAVVTEMTDGASAINAGQLVKLSGSPGQSARMEPKG